MAKKDKPLLVYLDQRLHGHLARMAEEEDVSMGHLVRRALVGFYKLSASTPRRTRKRNTSN